jgi:hypothetical protein
MPPLRAASARLHGLVLSCKPKSHNIDLNPQAGSIKRAVAPAPETL